MNLNLDLKNKKNDFEIFNLPKKFSIDLNLLNQKWKELQKQFHPDKLVNQENKNNQNHQQKILIEWSIRINTAYQRLKNPIKRAIYLCELFGEKIEIENNNQMDFEFLEQQLEWREKLEVIKEKNNLEKLESFKLEIQNNFNSLLKNCENLLNNPEEKLNIKKSIKLINQLMFIEKFLKDIEN